MTTTDNNDKVIPYRMCQASCLAFCALMACHTVPAILENCYSIYENWGSQKDVVGSVFLIGLYGFFLLPAISVLKLYKGLGRHIEVIRYGFPDVARELPPRSKDCLNVSEGESLDGTDYI